MPSDPAVTTGCSAVCLIRAHAMCIPLRILLLWAAKKYRPYKINNGFEVHSGPTLLVLLIEDYPIVTTFFSM
jgi:hypothetical protein